MSVNSITNAVAYLVETPEFKSKEAKQAMLRAEDDFGSASFPKEVYLTVVADASNKPAEYAISLSFKKLDATAVREKKRLEEVEAEEKATKLDIKEKQDKADQKSTS